MPDDKRDSGTSSQSVSAATESARISVDPSLPWQVDWKNPTWKQYLVPGDASSTSPSTQRKKNQDRRETIVGVSTAQVHGREIAQACPSLWASLQSSTTDVSFDEDGDEQDDPGYWLLTVTLIDPSGESCRNRQTGNPPVASEILLELMHCDAQQILHSRRLVWPETIGSDLQRRKEAIKKPNRWTELGDIFLAWQKPHKMDEKNADQQTTFPPSDMGVVAASLCRQPLTKEAKRDEALEVISSIMVGIGSSMFSVGEEEIDKEEINHAVSASLDKNTTGGGQEDAIDEQSDSGTDPLFLACLSSHGLICIYHVWDLLSVVVPLEGEPQGGSIGTASSEVNEERAIAFWLFGAELFQQLESTWLPLSQPTTTISLSILNEAWSPQRKRDHSREDEIINLAENESQQDFYEPSSPNQAISSTLSHPKSATSLLTWNPWIEASTLSQRTIYNQAMSINVLGPSCPFFVILGQGIPQSSLLVSSEKRKRKRKLAFPHEKNGKTTVETHSNDDDSKENSKVEPTVASAEAGGAKQEWWKGDLSSAEKEESPNPDHDQNYDWWASGDIPVAQSRKSEEKVAREKHPRSGLQTKEFHVNDSNLSLGGFITFCSTASWSETKTLFLDFIPRSVTHIRQWHGMELVLCIGDDRAVAVRMDMSPSPVLIGMDEELKSVLSNRFGYHHAHSPTVPIKRFQILPVDLQLPTKRNSTSTMESRVLCGAGTAPPALLQMYSEKSLRSKQETGLLVTPRFVGLSEKGHIITSTQETGRVAQIPIQEEENQDSSLFRSAWGYLGQGWSLFGTGIRTYFVCWEGATTDSGMSFLRELPESPTGIHSPLCVTTVLQFPNHVKAASRVLENNSRLPYQEADKESRNTNGIIEREPDSFDLVTEAIQGISSIRLEEATSAVGTLDPKEGSTILVPLSHQEKSERLLRHLSSWTQLEETNENRESLDRHLPVFAIKSDIESSTVSGSLSILRMRQIVMENGEASPFSQVLGWLSQKQDYFTAASIALDLLRDPQTLYHLWKNAEKIDEEDEQSKLKGLLNGIVPVTIVESDDKSTNQSPTSAPWTQLADMTVGCLIKGGLAMSSTLRLFLQTNRCYDPARASLMLVATLANTVSGDEAAIIAAMGGRSEVSCSASQYSIPQLLWPLQCLLVIGVARDYLKIILNLLNATIPEEMRCRPRQVGAMTLPPLDLTKAIITMIVSCDDGAAGLLLDLPSDQPSSSFWESLDCESQHSLALITIGQKYPMLVQEEVREWVRKQVNCALKESKNPEAASLEWLRELATACLFNAGCDLKDFVLDPTNMSMMSVESDNFAMFAELEKGCEDGLLQHKLEIVETRNALEPPPGSSGLDFDVLISCLLLLQSRQAAWREESEKFVSTQALLDAACYLAGRPTGRSEESRFLLDAKTLMEECALSGNVRAGANLIGGKNGFVLHCCDILMLELQVAMEDAEDFFLSEKLNSERIITVESSKFQQKHFELTESHRQLLWLLDEHVLSIRTYGEFESSQYSRGRVDPVFAARSIFRAWLCLTHSCKQKGSDWIGRWLAVRLGLHQEVTGQHRLACAATVRALLWPGDGHDFSQEDAMAPDSLLGHVLQMDKQFLIQLALSSCGLVESVPPPIADSLIGLVDATQELSTNLASLRLGRMV